MDRVSEGAKSKPRALALGDEPLGPSLRTWGKPGEDDQGVDKDAQPSGCYFG